MEWLNDNSDALMVMITLVYVVATIFIWKANKISAQASKEQLEESKRQFDESQKQARAELDETKRQFEEQKKQFEQTLCPYISCEYILKNSSLCCIRFTNFGTRPAYNVKFRINDDFVEALENPFKESFRSLNSTASYSFGIGQSYDFYFGAIKDFKINKRDFKVTVEYDWNDQHYCNDTIIEFTKYLPNYSTNEFEDNLLKEIKGISTAISELSKQVENMSEKSTQ